MGREGEARGGGEVEEGRKMPAGWFAFLYSAGSSRR